VLTGISTTNSNTSQLNPQSLKLLKHFHIHSLDEKLSPADISKAVLYWLKNTSSVYEVLCKKSALLCYISHVLIDALCMPLRLCLERNGKCAIYYPAVSCTFTEHYLLPTIFINSMWNIMQWYMILLTDQKMIGHTLWIKFICLMPFTNICCCFKGAIHSPKGFLGTPY